MMARVLVVPWSIAMTNLSVMNSHFLVCCANGSGEQDLGGQATEDTTDEGTDDRDPGVAPVGAALALDREDGVHDAGAEVTRRVDRVSGGATEADADAEDEQSDSEC